MGRLWLPVEKDWRLNERHYGGLTGLNKAETAAKHGNDQVKIWRRSFDTPPPPLEPGSEFDLSKDRSEEHTSELQSLMRISYAVFCLQKKNTTYHVPSTLPSNYHQ